MDFRAACFCHKRVVDIGFVCSICLSSEYSPVDSRPRDSAAMVSASAAVAVGDGGLDGVMEQVRGNF